MAGYKFLLYFAKYDDDYLKKGKFSPADYPDETEEFQSLFNEFSFDIIPIIETNTDEEKELFKQLIAKTEPMVSLKSEDNGFFKISNSIDQITDKYKPWASLSSEKKEIIFLKCFVLQFITTRMINQVLINQLLIADNFGSTRETPKLFYHLENNKFKDDEYYSLLNQIPTKEKVLYYLNNPNDQDSEYENEFLMSKFHKIIKQMNFGKSLYTEKKGDRGYVKILLSNDSSIDLVDTSSGLQQTIPIILKLLVARPYYFPAYMSNALLSIEQPELHLHPKLQSSLIELLVGKYLLIETHSEHIIRKIQVLFAKGTITKDDLIINYFDNKTGELKVKEMELLENGFFKEPWPDGFFDDSYNLAKELIYAQRN